MLFGNFQIINFYVAKCLEKRVREIIESNLRDTQYGFRPAVAIHTTLHSPTNFEKYWEYAKYVFTCFVDLEKAYDRVPCEKLWGVFREHGVDGRY